MAPTDTNIAEHYDRIGMVARWQPVHLGQAPVLQALCERSSLALIGVGSSNRHNLRNPFTLDERTAMLQLSLSGRADYSLIPVPDLDDGPRWRAMVVELFGPLDRFVTDNPYVASLLGSEYTLMRPVDLVPETQRVPLNGTQVRREMARGDGWRAMVPEQVASYITAHDLDRRFRREFGLQTLALDAADGRIDVFMG